ncbi:MAG: TrkA family potassium uptake protein [Clostridia bacterium]|nr:TrkA family potassium uptake protein [Clostridia bacterium]
MLVAKKVILVGCGRLGAGLAERLSDEGCHVIIVDTDKTAFRRLPDNYSGFEITGDGTDMEILKSAEIEEVDKLIAVTGDDNTNSLIAQIARKIFSVKDVCIRVHDESKKELVSDMGISVVCPKLLAMDEFSRLISSGDKIAEE